MKAICFYFQVHQPFRFKRYRFFDIGTDHYYYDDFANEEMIRGIASRTYSPANKLLLEMIEKYNGEFKVAFSISGTVLEQLEIYVPEVIDQFKKLAATGCVEFLAETYSHSLSSLTNSKEFVKQIRAHTKKIQLLFGKLPKIFRNSELIYSDNIALQIADMGFDAALIEGAKHILGWKSPHYLYSSASFPKLKLLTRNMKFSDDITFRFSNGKWSEYPLVADKFVRWIAETPNPEQLINIFTTYDVFGGLQASHTGIFDFFEAIPHFALQQEICFLMPSEVVDTFKSAGELSVPYPCSWAGEEKDVSAWMGNVLQKEAIHKLYAIAEKVHLVSDRRVLQDWNSLQATDHFHYMSLKYFSGESVFSPYENAYDAFNNYMNILSDFIERVNRQFPEEVENEELNALQTTILNQDEEIKRLKKELQKIKKPQLIKKVKDKPFIKKQ